MKIDLNWSWIILLAISLNAVVCASYFLYIAKPVVNLGATFKEVGWPFKSVVGLSYSLNDSHQSFFGQLTELVFSSGFWLNFGSYTAVAIAISAAVQAMRS